MKKDKAKGKKSKIAMYAVGGAAGILVLGAAGAMIGFGNIAGTLANGAGVVGSAGRGPRRGHRQRRVADRRRVLHRLRRLR